MRVEEVSLHTDLIDKAYLRITDHGEIDLIVNLEHEPEPVFKDRKVSEYEFKQICTLQVSKESEIFVSNDIVQVLNKSSGEYLKIDLKQTIQNFIDQQSSSFDILKVAFSYQGGCVFNQVFIVKVSHDLTMCDLPQMCYSSDLLNTQKVNLSEQFNITDICQILDQMVPKPKIDLSKQQKGQDYVIEELKNYSSEILKYSQARFDHTEVYSKKL